MAPKKKSDAQIVPDPDTLNPQEMADFLERGWLYYSHQKFEAAETDFHTVLDKEPDNIDALYGLGLALKSLGKSQQALEAFEQIDYGINRIEDHQRALMISRLAHGQINQIKIGEWNLEKEVWKSSKP